MKRRAKILLFLFLILLLLGGFFGFNLLPVFAEDSCNNHIVISEIYGGGGNSGATYKNDFIELYNPTTLDIVIDGWSVQYASKNGNFSITSSSYATMLNGKISAKSYYLIEEKNGSGGTTNLPTPDKIGTIALSATDGKVVLAKSVQKVSGIGDENIIDFVGYGNANEYEGTSGSAAPDNTRSIFRKNNLCLDSNDNKNDFEKQVSNPQNSSYLEPEPIIYSDKIKINEIFPNPSGSSEKKNEFVEIFNSGDVAIDLTDWYLSGKSSTFELSGIIEAGKYKAFFDTITLYNEKSTVKLFNPIDEQADEITYPDPTAELENFSYSFDGTDWFWTSTPTADKENQFDPVEDTSDTATDTSAEDSSSDYNVYLNEILPNPKGDEKLEEFIEIYNAENSEVNLSGWTLKDASKTKYVFPTNTTIAAGKYWAIYRPTFKFAMNNSGAETIYLLDKNDTLISSVSYTGAKEDVSYNFDDTDWHWSGFLTPGKKISLRKNQKWLS